MKLNEDEKIIFKCSAQNCTNSEFSVKGQLYLTNKRLVFVASKTLETTMNIELDQLEKISKYKLLFFLNNGFVLYLKNGMEYSIAFWQFSKLVALLSENHKIEITHKPRHRWLQTLILSVLISYFIIIPSVAAVIDTYKRYVFMKDPIGYVKTLQETNDNPTWRISSVGGYPNLNGQWQFYDDNNDCTYILDINLESDIYKLKYKFDQSPNYQIMSSGKFKIVNGKDQYGDNHILGVKFNTSKSEYEYHCHSHIFSVNDWLSGYCLRLGPSSNVHNNMFGEQMSKISNKSEDQQ